MATKLRNLVDWEAVERDYRTTNKTLRELGALHHVDHSQLGKRAKTYGWTRDLTKQVRQAIRSAIAKEAVEQAVAQAAADANNTQKTVDAVLVSAEIGKSVILAHRSDIKDTRDLAFAMLGELRATTLQHDDVLALMESASADLPQTQGDAFMRQARDLLKLHNRVASVQKLTDTLGKLQTLERKAFDLDDLPPGDENAPREFIVNYRTPNAAGD